LGSGLEAIAAMTGANDQIERVNGPSRCPGAAERFWVWPMPMARLLALATVLGPPLALIALLTNSTF